MSRFRRPASFTHNLIIVGAGAAGLVVALAGSAVKARVALVERERMGGDCLYTGCVPSKTLIRSATIASYINRADHFGIQVEPGRVDFSRVMERVQAVIRRMEPHDSVERYTRMGVDCYSAAGRLRSPWELDCGKLVLSAPNMVLATGTEPLVPPLPGLDEVPWLTTTTLWQESELPRRLLVLGGGPAGCELAQAFSRLGSAVTLVETAPDLLPKEDAEASSIIARCLAADGVRILTSHRAVRFVRDQNAGVVHLESDLTSAVTQVRFDRVLLAMGRRPRTEGLGLEELGVELREDGSIQVDKYLRTSVSNLYAAGDVTGPYRFTHMASHQAWYAGVNALFGSIGRFRVNYSAVPWAIYTDPEVATVGLTERQALALGRRFEVTRLDLTDSDRAITDGMETGFIKVLTPPGRDRILGVTLVGHRAGEMLAEYVLAMSHGMGLRALLSTIHVYPTLTELNRFAAGAWRRKHAPAWLLKLAGRLHAWRRS